MLCCCVYQHRKAIRMLRHTCLPVVFHAHFEAARTHASDEMRSTRHTTHMRNGRQRLPRNNVSAVSLGHNYKFSALCLRACGFIDVSRTLSCFWTSRARHVTVSNKLRFSKAKRFVCKRLSARPWCPRQCVKVRAQQHGETLCTHRQSEIDLVKRRINV